VRKLSKDLDVKVLNYEKDLELRILFFDLKNPEEFSL